MRGALLFVLLVSPVLTGCDQVGEWLFDPERLNPGTVAAVDACVKKSKSEVFSVDAARAVCAHKHQRQLRLEEISLVAGRLGFVGDSGYGTNSGDQVSVTIENRSSKFVVTAVGVTVNSDVAVDSDQFTVSNGVSGPIWVEPGQSKAVRFSIQKSIEYRKNGKSLYEWDYLLGNVFVVPTSIERSQLEQRSLDEIFKE